MKKRVRIFISYAHRNQKLADSFIEHFKEYAEPSLTYEYLWWRDNTHILVGDDWDKEIKTALKQCDLGLLLVSASFLGSKYITEVELKELRSKPIVPVELAPIDLERYDLKGLQKKKIFELKNPRFIAPKSYSECTPNQRDQFVLGLFRQVESKLDELA